jgi:7-cyano-7-deazaguanine synthase
VNEGKVIILSGGLDSTVLLHILLKHKEPIYGLSFNYGQKHKKELIYAREWGLIHCKEWKLVDLNFLASISQNSALVNRRIKVPEEHYEHENQKSTVIPNRNMIMLSIGVAWAESMNLREVYYGAHKNDHAIYPDCRPQFLSALTEASQEGTYNHVMIKAPFIHDLKEHIVGYGHRLNVDFRRTWSCYKGGDKHCGKCGTCQERIKAFKDAGIEDPTEYESEVGE